MLREGRGMNPINIRVTVAILSIWNIAFAAPETSSPRSSIALEPPSRTTRDWCFKVQPADYLGQLV